MFTQSGSRLLEALTAPHGVDRYVELIRPVWSRGDARARVIAVRRTTADSVTLTLRPNAAWAGFKAGQFIRLAVEIDGVRQTRCYSPACSQHQRATIELTVKAHGEGLVSRHLHERARPGMVVGLSAADGDFVLPDVRPDRVLLISGGSGITPVMSMLRTLCDEGRGDTVTLMHYSPSAEDAIYRDELALLATRHHGMRIAHAHTRIPAGGALDGHLTAAHLDAVAPGWREAHAYVCGPPALIDTARTLWREQDAEQRLHVESFLPPTLAIASDAAEGTVRFATTGAQVPNDGRSLLEQAESAGLRPEYGCRMGICHTCTCRKTAGSVRNVLSGEVCSDEDVEIQICISAPVGDVELAL